MRVAIVHHWFVTQGGGERCAECIANLFPAAEIFTLLAAEKAIPATLRGRTIHTSFLQKIPGAASWHRHLMPLYPAATRSLDLRGFDLILTSDSGPVKGIRMDPGATQICYCHSPMRYLYDNYEVYRRGMGRWVRAVFTATAGRVRRFDQKAARQVSRFIANSRYIQARILRFYGRNSVVIPPPVNLERARIGAVGEHYLAAGRMVGYKRTELLIEACLELGRRLRVVGGGPEAQSLRRLAAAHRHGPLIEFLGELPNDGLWQNYAECRALLFAADEDFGMVPLEAQACGRPVICYGAGGSLETVSPATGVYFAEQTVASVIDGIRDFEAREAEFSPAVCQAFAASFGTERFLRDIRAYVLECMPEAAEAAVAVEELDAVAARLAYS